jgi:hypothetical protein
MIYPAIPYKWGFWSIVKPSKMQEVMFEGLRSRKPLYIAPYVLGGFGRKKNLNEEETTYINEDQLARNAGLDLKYGLTSNLTMDLTVNTDFAQVEADEQQVNLTRYSLFFPEKGFFSRNAPATLSSISGSITVCSTAGGSGSIRVRKWGFTEVPGWSAGWGDGMWVFWTCRPGRPMNFLPRISGSFGSADG